MDQHRSDLPIAANLGRRYSPRAFRADPVTNEQLDLLFEAARWASSSRNEQPWRFVVSRKGSPAFDRMLGILNTSNSIWAQLGGALVLVLAKRHFDRDGSANHHAWHDVGLAVGNLAAQATEMGLGLHQMGGFNAAAAREVFQVPDKFDLVTVVVIGWPGTPDDLPENLRDRERNRSARRPLDGIRTYDVAPVE
ncbi:MAG: nitroreductase family protein [Flavobacteriales bacterium]|nr:nitroreductase family protein [Flavobacteriales bacterium]